MKKKYVLIIFVFLYHTITFCQRKEIKGSILNADSEGIHVINKTANLFTITDENGVFYINAAIGDVLVLSSVQYDLKIIEMTNDMYLDEELTIALKDNLTELEDVLVGVQLSGDLNKDLKGIEVEEHFSPEDVGIPEYHGVREEKIVPIFYAITPTSINIEAVYKHLSGYYKTLKATRKMDKENKSIEDIHDFYGKAFLSSVYNLPKDRLHEFLLFCIETSTIEDEFANGNHNIVLEILSNKRKEIIEGKE